MNGIPTRHFRRRLASRDFTFVEDTARAIALAGATDAAVGTTIFNVSSGMEVSISDLARLVLE